MLTSVEKFHVLDSILNIILKKPYLFKIYPYKFARKIYTYILIYVIIAGGSVYLCAVLLKNFSLFLVILMILNVLGLNLSPQAAIGECKLVKQKLYTG